MEEPNQYIYGSLILDDIIVTALFFAFRIVYDMHHAKAVLTAKNEVFSIITFWKKNWLLYLSALMCCIGLMMALPEFIGWVCSSIFKWQGFTWNLLFSAIVGYAPIKLFLFIKKKLKERAEKYVQNH